MATVQAMTSHMTPLKQLERHLCQLIADNLAVVFDFLILQDKHNIRTLSENI